MQGNYPAWRALRQKAAAIRDTLPDLSTALEEYARNLDEMVDLAHVGSSRLIFVTQPSMWSDDLSPEDRALLWLGGVGNFQRQPSSEYYSVAALRTGLEMYNEVLLGVCRDRGVECIDLASILARDHALFYDGVHFTEKGGRAVASVLAEFLLERPPYSDNLRTEGGIDERRASGALPARLGPSPSIAHARLRLRAVISPRPP